MRQVRLFPAAMLAVASCCAFAAGQASATFHDMSIREVYPGSLAQQNSEYVELQMWSGGQDEVGGHPIRTYDASGKEVKANPFPANVPSGANQSTVLMATPEAASQFGVTADAAFVTSGQLDPAGGAVCWESIDCVSWGSFKGSLPSPTGSPAPAIPDAMALRRTIAPGCATALERNDDRDDSALDFSAVFPQPRPNSVAPSERTCARSGGQNPEGSDGGGNHHGAPQTTLRRKPAKKTRDRTPTFRFTADEPGSTFQCKVDAKPFKACQSPFTAKRLALGRHTFKVRARHGSDAVDPSPAAYSFKVIPARSR